MRRECPETASAAAIVVVDAIGASLTVKHGKVKTCAHGFNLCVGWSVDAVHAIFTLCTVCAVPHRHGGPNIVDLPFGTSSCVELAQQTVCSGGMLSLFSLRVSSW